MSREGIAGFNQPLSKEDFLVGTPFVYTGHFIGLTQRELTYEPAECVVIDTREKTSWSAHSIQLNGVYLFKREFGRVCIFYGECKKKKNELPVNQL